MSLKVYNTLTKQKEDFIPIEDGKVRMYVCGMTVYSDAHIGHARTYYAFDVIRRYLEYKGYKVTYVQNVTDVDDKIIAAANKQGMDPLEYSKIYLERCLGDLDALGIRRADIYPKASEEIPAMIEMIQKIIENGYGYEANGDVYFSVEKFKDYGKLSGQNIEELTAGARIEPGEKKRNPLDFALWKHMKPGEPFWDSPWGPGRPGWHIECSAMSSKYLGLPFDIHGGGMDLRFPHHENEIAQAEAATGKPFVKYWLHCGLLTVDGEKMSKSLGNIINIRDILKTWDPEVIRFFFAQTHYRRPPDFNETALKNAEKGLTRIYRLKDRLHDISKDVEDYSIDESTLSENDKQYYSAIENFKTKFEEAMDDDFNTPEAVAVLFEFINQSNKYLELEENPNKKLCRYAYETLLELGRIITLFQEDKKEEREEEVINSLRDIINRYQPELLIEKDDISAMMKQILEIREEARRQRDWNKADSIRDELTKIGFEIQDTADGPVWRRRII
ncbi:MAG: cysteine--tRNA ligase [Thermoplasmata archaeon]|nr:MAG: cysteine--tRNA ligase [Thermoplasmata archaeon]HEC89427.1 cysteine--tRNA ligase [Thermoplasmatales archaeon]